MKIIKIKNQKQYKKIVEQHLFGQIKIKNLTFKFGEILHKKLKLERTYETEKALLIKLFHDNKPLYSSWFPKSQIKIEKKKFTIPFWMVKKITQGFEPFVFSLEIE